MTHTRRPSYMLMREISTPATPIPDTAWLFARDIAGVTTGSIEFSSGSISDFSDGSGGGGGGAPEGEYINVARDFGGNVITALAAAKAGDTVFCPSMNVAGTAVQTYSPSSQVVVPAGVHLKGARVVGEATHCRIQAGSSFPSGQALVNVLGGGQLSGFTIDGAGATHAVLCSGDATTIEHLALHGGSQYTLQNSPGTNRQRWGHLRVMGDNTPSKAVMQCNGDYNQIFSTVSTSTSAPAHSTWITGNYNYISGGHWTGDAGSVSPGRVDGRGNILFQVFTDTVGTQGEALWSVRGPNNIFFGCGGMNAGVAGKSLYAIWGVEGNMIFGAYYVNGGKKTNLGRFVTFMTSAGVATTNKALFNGTRITGSASSCNDTHNLTGLTTGDAIDIVLWTSSGNTNVRT